MKRFAVLLLVIMSIFLWKGEKVMAQEDDSLETATLAGGCFWCLQPPYDALPGVKETVVGYTGGKVENPTYEQVSAGQTGHAESVQITFDPKLTSYRDILQVFWQNINPTTLNKQFADEGAQYRTAIFYHSEEQKKIAEETKAEYEASGKFDGPIVTQITPAQAFYPAEEYHQDYYQKNPLRYKFFKRASGRTGYLKKLWGK